MCNIVGGARVVDVYSMLQNTWQRYTYIYIVYTNPCACICMCALYMCVVGAVPSSKGIHDDLSVLQQVSNN